MNWTAFAKARTASRPTRKGSAASLTVPHLHSGVLDLIVLHLFPDESRQTLRVGSIRHVRE